MEKNKHNEMHPKQGFQVDRIAFFSDAIFAIVITLLVIELKVPEMKATSTREEVLKELYDLKYNFVAIIFSFFVIAQQWFQHHFLFKYIHNYNKKMLWASVLMLLPIIFFPFSTGFFAESTIDANVVILGVRVFTLNTLLSVISIFYFYYVTFIKNKDFTYPIPYQEKGKFLANNLFSFIFSFVIMLITFVSDEFHYIPWLLAPLALAKKPFEYFIIKKLKLAEA